MAKSGKQMAGKRKPNTGSARTKKASPRVKVTSSELRYSGPLFDVYTDWIRENGHASRRDVVRHGGSAVILAVEDASKPDPTLIVERQYRHAAGKYLFEIPAGTLNPGEDPLRGAKRELAEETGLRARRWRKLARFYASPGFLAEWMQIYLAEGLTRGESAPDADEQIEMRTMPLSRLLGMIERGKIQDGKTIIAALLLGRMCRGAKASSKK